MGWCSMNAKKSWPVIGLAVGAAIICIIRRLHVRAKTLAWQMKQSLDVDVLACPTCHRPLFRIAEGLQCAQCHKIYPIIDGIPHFVEPYRLTGLNKRFSKLYDWFSWIYRSFSRVAFALIGISEEQARREVTDRLEPHGGRVLEVSIGPGVNLPYLINRSDVGEVFGLDISPGQLQRCQEFAAHQDWQVQLHLANAEQLPYADGAFDSVFHIGGINFFNDKKKAIEEMIRVAKPGARILIADENEKGARGYEKIFPGFGRNFDGQREMIMPPIDLVPESMLERRIFDIWKDWFYCIEFRKPSIIEV